MFNVRLFLRNHAAPCRWADLSADVRRLFASPDGSLAWAEFYVADAARRCARHHDDQIGDVRGAERTPAGAENFLSTLNSYYQSMAKLILKNPNTGIIKQAPMGFSWTTLFFGPLPALLRGDFKWFFIQVILDALLIMPVLVFPFIYNRLYLKRRLETGYKVKAVQGATIEKLNLRLGLELPMLPGK